MTKGFVISVDALLSAVILFSLLTLAFDTLKQDGTDWQITRTLEILAHQSGEALEVSGTLSSAVILNNTNGVRTFLDGLPYNTCASITVRSSPDSNVNLFTVSKSGCTALLGESVSVSRGFMVASPPDANLYIANISTWLNREV
jgi:hypothetical protein